MKESIDEEEKYAIIRKLINSKDEKVILKSNLEYLLKIQKHHKIKINTYIIKLSKFELRDCIKSIKKCSSFYFQLLKTIQNLVDLCNSQKEQKVKYYLEMIIKKLEKDHDSLIIIEDNLINSYCN